MTPIAPHSTAYLRERLPLQRGASQHTCDSYAHTFRLLFEFVSGRLKVTPSKLSLEQIDAQTVMDFLAHLESGRNNCARTRNARLAAIKSFMRYVEHRVPSILEQSLRILAIPTKKTDTALVNYLSKEEMQVILNAPDIRTRSGIQDRAMLHVGFAAGLRVSELTGLLLNKVTLQPSPTVCIIGKGQCTRAGNDARRFCVHASPTRPSRYGGLPVASQQADFAACFEAYLRYDSLPSDWRFA